MTTWFRRCIGTAFGQFNLGSHNVMVTAFGSCVKWPLLTSGIRATSYTSQEPWPCNGEDPWFSSKGRTMGVGRVVLGSHGTSSIVWSESGPCCETIAYFVGGKGGEDLVSYSMSQTLRIWENYLVILVSHGIYYKICYEICPEFVMLEYFYKKYIKKPLKIMVSRNLRQAHLLEVGMT